MLGKRAIPLTRTEIADAAIRIVGDRGISALTTTALAKELGVSSGAPFRHFSSREEILMAVGERVVELIGTTFPDPGLPPLERLARLFVARIETVIRHGGVARLIFSEQFSKALPEQAAAMIRDFVRRTREYALAAIVEAAARGEIRQDIPAEHLLLMFVGAMQHTVFWSSLNLEPDQLAAMAPRDIVDSIWILMAPPKGSPLK